MRRFRFFKKDGNIVELDGIIQAIYLNFPKDNGTCRIETERADGQVVFSENVISVESEEIK